MSALLAGAVLTETIFSWPGVGKWLIDSISRRDYPALQGGVMLVSLVVIVVNLIVDLLYGAINPQDPPWTLNCVAAGPCRDDGAPRLLGASVAARRVLGRRFARTGARCSACRSSLSSSRWRSLAGVIAPHSPIEQFRDAGQGAAGLGGGRFVALHARAPTAPAATCSRA